VKARNTILLNEYADQLAAIGVNGDSCVEEQLTIQIPADEAETADAFKIADTGRQTGCHKPKLNSVFACFRGKRILESFTLRFPKIA
jgi:hypothetical protein